MTAPAAGPADQAIRDAAMRDLETSFFLQAGAGTGKTSVLVGRVVEIVRTGRAQLREIVAITFTEKAAGELRDRIRRDLYQAMRAAEQAEAQRLRRALEQVDSAAIETIHAFASRLLRERPLEAGLDPHFAVLDAVSEQLNFDETWEEWLWSERDEQARPRVERCLRLDLTLDHLRRLTHTIAESRDLDPRQPSPPPEPPEGFYRWVRREAERLGALAEAVGEAAAARTTEFRRRVEALEGLPGPALEAGLTGLTLKKPRLGRSASDARIEFEDAADTLRDRLAAYTERVRAHALAEFIEVAYAFVLEATAERRRRGTLTFADLLIEARAMLVREARTRRYFRERYPFLLIDEFQDTDPLQAEIVLLLTASEDTNDWRVARPQPGRLFIVGDPKQSIYRFRRADIDVYAEVQSIFAAERERTPGSTRIEALDVNFRSRPSLVAWHNAIFRTLIRRDPDFPNAQPAYHPLVPFRDDEPFSVINLRPNVGVSWGRIGEARADEAQALVRFIETVVNTEEFALSLPDRETGEERAPRYRDICLLVRDRTNLEIYSDALADAGIPYHLDSGRGFFLQQEIRDAAAILTALDDPSDEVALVAALKSAPFAASDLELFEYHRAGGRFRLVPEAIPGDYAGPLRAPLETLLQLHAAMPHHSLPGYVDLVLRTTHLMEIQLARRSPQRAANLHIIVQRAADFAANEVDSLRPFVRWLSTQTRTDLAEAEAPVTEVEDDVVRILTIHQAKGLEFPIVVLAKMARATAPDRSISVINRDAGTIDFQTGTRDHRFQTPGFDAAQARQQHYEAAEERRLFYVAATRARDYLVLPTFFTERAYGYHADLEEALPGWTSDQDVAAPGAVTCRVEQLVRAPRAAAEVLLPDLDTLVTDWTEAHHAALREGASRWEFVAPSALGHDDVKIARETEPPDRAAADIDPDIAGEGGGANAAEASADSVLESVAAAARQRGTILHDALYYANFQDPESSAWRAANLCQERGAPDLEATVVADLRTTLASPLMARARAARRVEREMPLVLANADRITEGYVDLAFEEAEGWVLVDYKSDRRPSQATVQGYEAQVRAYVQAFRATGVPVHAAFLLFTADGRDHPVPLT